MHYKRSLQLPHLLKMKSHFLFGPRSTGKTTLIEDQLKSVLVYDLLDDNTFVALTRNPKLIEEQNILNPKIVVIDEIQKLPKILDEVHRLIKKHNWTFLLTGSSARKLKKGSVNLLAGRAWETHLFPLSFSEISDFNLIQYLNRGGLPHVYPSKNFESEIKNYVNIYLKEEIINEALVKNYEYFMDFLDVIALTNGQELNFENISRDSSVPARTVQNYVQILEDTLIAYQLMPFRKTKSRKAITKSKIYLFDIGVTNYIAKRGPIILGSETFGYAFEHFIINEVRTYLSYHGYDKQIVGPFYWRTVDKYEVDCLISNEVAIEIKASKSIKSHHLGGLIALQEEKIFKKYFIISQESNERVTETGIYILPWQIFLKRLWNKEIYS